jgi:hypothetical protein
MHKKRRTTMANKNAYLRMLPSGIANPMRKLLDKIQDGSINMGTLVGTSFTGAVTGAVTGNVTGNIAGASSLGVLEVGGQGAGSVGVGGINRAYKRTENGVIITTIEVDITGLGCKGGNADDAIGTGTVPAYIYEMTTAKNGIITEVTMECVEIPAGSGSATVDINLTMNSAGTIDYDEAVSNDYLFNSDVVFSAAGLKLVNIDPSFATTDFIYLTEGDAAATDGVYTAGQFVITLYGRAILA